jgi:hypothetical protein
MTGFREHAKTMLTKLHQVQLAMQQEPKTEGPNKAE